MSSPFATGRCLCGNVTVTANAAPVATGQCHCKDCQRTSGGGHASLAIFKSDDIQISGETKGYTVTVDRGHTYTRSFCPSCGSRMEAENEAAPGFIHISVGAFDDHDWFEPQRVLYTKDKPAWDLTSTDIPNFEAMPPSRKPKAAK